MFVPPASLYMKEADCLRNLIKFYAKLLWKCRLSEAGKMDERDSGAESDPAAAQCY